MRARLKEQGRMMLRRMRTTGNGECGESWGFQTSLPKQIVAGLLLCMYALQDSAIHRCKACQEGHMRLGAQEPGNG